MNDVATIAPPKLDIQALSGRIGAEVRGIALSDTLDEARIRSIREALLRHKVLFFRGQRHLDQAAQEGFAQLLGEPVPHPTVPSLEGISYILDIDGSHGVGSADSRHLFDIFQSHVVRHENTVRWRWAPGDVAMSDNRATQHRAVDDYGDQPRVARRVTLRSDRPVSVDGRTSAAIRPRA